MTKKEEYEIHMKTCQQCSNKDPNISLCYVGFKLMQEALKETPQKDSDGTIGDKRSTTGLEPE